MLDELVVVNLGILERARIEPGSGFTVVTGETGAGKTLLVGALRLLLGGLADSDLVGPFGDEAVVEGRFVKPTGEEIGASRRLSRVGRSRAYLNGSIASAAALEESTRGLVEIVAQHDHLALNRPSEIRRLVDRLLDADGRRASEAYVEAWERLSRLQADLERLGGDRRALERERDLAAYQAQEIAAAGFAEGEDTELEARLARLRNVEELRTLLGGAVAGVDTAREVLGGAVAGLRKAARLDSSLEELSVELGTVEDRIGDVALRLGSVLDGLDDDPLVLESAEERYRLLTDLRKKYGSTLSEVLAYGRQAAARAEEIGGLLERADRLDAEIAAATASLAKAAEHLRAARTRAGRRLAEGAEGHLRELGFASPVVEVTVEADDPGPHGADRVRMLFASDERLEPGEVSRVASGGELSRLVLATRLVAADDEAQAVLVFDEIDAGVGGATGLALGKKLAELARHRQVLCVSHLPQVAAFADTHYVVSRTGARAEVHRIEGAERVEELARMLAGLPDSPRGRRAAEELLAHAERR